jgi:hypothetical protein
MLHMGYVGAAAARMNILSSMRLGALAAWQTGIIRAHHTPLWEQTFIPPTQCCVNMVLIHNPSARIGLS